MKARLAPRVARRLARRASRRDPPGLRGRLALRRLDRAVRRRDPVALRAVWQRWLDVPSPLLWEIISMRPDAAFGAVDESWMLREVAFGRLPRPYDGRLGPVLAAALDRPGHPVRDAAAALLLGAPAEAVDAVCAAAMDEPGGVLARFCVENQLVPADPVARAVFLVRTGQGAPDARLLSIGYAGADLGRRQRLRTAIAGNGDVDLVRVVTGQARPLTPDEITDLVAWHAAREDRPGLWRLVTDVSPAGAVELIRLFPDRWRPDDPAGRRLFDVLAATPPEAMTAYQDHPLPVGFTIAAASFAPDGTQVALFGHRGRSSRLAFVSLPGLTVLAEHRWRDKWAYATKGLLHLGASAILTGVTPQRFTADSREDLPYTSHPPFSEHAGQHRHGWTGAHWQTVYLGSYDDPGRPREIDLGEHRIRLGSLAVEPGTGEFAILDGASSLADRLVLFGRDGRKLAACEVNRLLPRHYPYLVAFTGPGRLITAGYRGGLARWRRDGDTLELETAIETPKVYGLHALPTVDRIVLGEFEQPWHNAETLLPARPGFTTGRRPSLWTSPDGAWTAEPTALHGLRLPAPLARLVDRPQTAMTRDDLAAVAEADVDDPAARAIRACLEHRFGAL